MADERIGTLKILGEAITNTTTLNLPRRPREPAKVNLGEIQGNVLRGYTHPVAAYIFLRVDDVKKGKALLARMIPRIISGEPWQSPPSVALQIAFTYAGLKHVGVSDEILDTFPEEFRQGMAVRAEALGDRGTNAPEHWEKGLGTGEAHVLLTVWAVDNAHLDAVREELRQVGAEHGATTVINETRAEELSAGKDHFGFFDGISQPAVEGSGTQGRPGDGQPNGSGGWRDVATGEFLLGYVDEDESMPIAPAAPFDKDGTFMVYRKLQMDVAAFRRMIVEQGKHYPGGPEKLAAKIVGRWPDGTPVALSPDAPDPKLTADPQAINDFSYHGDPQGLRCPVGAHIRRCHPRDSEGFFGGRLTNRHRIIRRGRSYGPPLEPGAMQDDGAERGLVFVCFNASIWRQFETIQKLWVDDGDPFWLGPDPDPLIGCPAPGAKMTIQGNPPYFIRPRQLVTMRGGEYLFQPSISALRWLTT